MKTQVLIGIAVTALLAGFASTSGAQSGPTTGAAKAPAHNPGAGVMTDTCPMQVPGTNVTSADVKGGVALAFTTRTGDVAELRQRVRRAAEMHNRHDAGSGMMMGRHGRGSDDTNPPGHGAGAAPGQVGSDREGMIMGDGMMMPAATASVEDIKGGARLFFQPKDPAQLEALRKHVRTHVERIARGECPMMSAGAEGQATPLPSAADPVHEGHYLYLSPPGK
jgi:hypothetical protein